MIATCGLTTVAEVEQLVPVGGIDPDHVHTAGIFVQRMIVSVNNEKRIEKRIVRQEA
jgi:acyl CoA:acetate/3-ketoacid CoA transferase alpha subunit